MTELPPDFDTGPRDPKVDSIIRAMHARFHATGSVNPEPYSAEGRSANKGWWRDFWESQFFVRWWRR